MFCRKSRCDACGVENMASEHMTTRLAYTSRVDGVRHYYDLCDRCLTEVITCILHHPDCSSYDPDDADITCEPDYSEDF